jgi:hypothetical protein
MYRTEWAIANLVIALIAIAVLILGVVWDY